MFFRTGGVSLLAAGQSHAQDVSAIVEKASHVAAALGYSTASSGLVAQGKGV